MSSLASSAAEQEQICRVRQKEPSSCASDGSRTWTTVIEWSLFCLWLYPSWNQDRQTGNNNQKMKIKFCWGLFVIFDILRSSNPLHYTLCFFFSFIKYLNELLERVFPKLCVSSNSLSLPVPGLAHLGAQHWQKPHPWDQKLFQLAAAGTLSFYTFFTNLNFVARC